jgi:phage repressor protein C with HTH and peptisase S24 domain
MLSHGRIWEAIDRLAADHNLSPSGLAKKAGLDPTTFNRSKRVAADGRERWPSTESLSKILAATGTEVGDFLGVNDHHQHRGFGEPASPAFRGVPLLGLAQAGAGGFFDDAGFPAGRGWDEVEFPAADENVFALEVTGDSMMPLYRDGDTIIVARDAAVRRGDRVVVKTRDGEVMAKVMQRKTARVVELASLNPAHTTRTLAVAEIEWMGRILWASQ